MKKIILSFILSTSLLGIFNGCYCDHILPYWNATTMDISVNEIVNNRFVPASNSVVNTDSLGIQILFGADFLALGYTPNNVFINACSAFKCITSGHSGMKDEISNIEITSNADYNVIVAGQPLNSIIHVSGTLLNNWLTEKGFNEMEFYGKDERIMQLLFAEKPSNNSLHNFKVKISFVSGREELLETGMITWN